MAKACCAGQVEAESDGVEVAALFKALADPTRVRIVEMLAGLDAGTDLCVCDLEGPLGLSQATVSHHLKKLLDAGLIDRDRRGTWSHYTINRDRFDHVRHLLDRIDA